jgi:pSer/pThr/pTyr-binding forkhead associated (FHA) protein
VQVTFSADSTLPPHQFHIRTGHIYQPEGHTTQIRLRDDGEPEALAALRALDAYLVIGGRQYISLDRPLFSIGRRTDNDIVLDSPTISRQHAQIRWRYGRFILYDLSRRGRTAVNDQPVTEHALQPGDVITLSDTRIIYGEEQDTHKKPIIDDESGQTMPMPKQ